MTGTVRLTMAMLLAACLSAAACRATLQPMPLAQMQQSDFTRCVGDTFTVAAATEPVALRLAEVTGKNDRTTVSFTLEFTGPADTPLGQGTHTVTHAQLGTFSLFLSPYMQKAGKIHYAASFSRLRE